MNEKPREIQLLKTEIQPLNDEVWANLSIEELEERLELQILQVAADLEICGGRCGVHCSSFSCGSFTPPPKSQ